jgi:hypothetical protein
MWNPRDLTPRWVNFLQAVVAAIATAAIAVNSAANASSTNGIIIAAIATGLNAILAAYPTQEEAEKSDH